MLQSVKAYYTRRRKHLGILWMFRICHTFLFFALVYFYDVLLGILWGAVLFVLPFFIVIWIDAMKDLWSLIKSLRIKEETYYDDLGVETAKVFRSHFSI